jgi:hypothetical protein
MMREERAVLRLKAERERKHRKAIPPCSASGGNGDRTNGSVAAHGAVANNSSGLSDLGGNDGRVRRGLHQPCQLPARPSTLRN